MLALPEFDTYHILEKFAQQPSITNSIALALLKARASTRINWDALGPSRNPDIPFRKYAELRMGVSRKASSVPSFAAMSTSERIAYYDKCCRKLGYDIDSLTSMSKS